MFRFAEAFHLTLEWECTILQVECSRPKPSAIVQVHQFLSDNLQTFTHWKETAWQLVELLNLNRCHNQKFIHNDLDETMSMWTDSETNKCLSNTCWLLLLLTVELAERVTNFQFMREIVSDTRLLLAATHFQQWAVFFIKNLFVFKWVFIKKNNNNKKKYLTKLKITFNWKLIFFIKFYFQLISYLIKDGLYISCLNLF